MPILCVWNTFLAPSSFSLFFIGILICDFHYRWQNYKKTVLRQQVPLYIQKILDNPDKETVELIKATQEDYKSEYLFHSWVHLLVRCSLYVPEYIFWVLFITSSNLGLFWFAQPPVDEKLHDLASLLNFDSTKVSGEMLGEESVRWHQQILQEHWGSGDTGVLPGDDIQQLLLGIGIVLYSWILFYFNDKNMSFYFTP